MLVFVKSSCCKKTELDKQNTYVRKTTLKILSNEDAATKAIT